MASREEEFRISLEQLSRSMGYGTYKGQAYDMFRGYNFRANGIATPASTDQTGYTFVTRTECNLTDKNLSQDRILTNLLTPNPWTVQSAVRAMLDPHCVDNGYGTPLVNNNYAWFTILFNTVSDVSGWPDQTMMDFVEPEGIMGEAYGMADGYYRYRGPWEATMSFVNTEGAPVLKLNDTLLLYMEGVLGIRLVPYAENNIENRMDYTMRMYRLIMDPSRRFCQHIMANGYMYPKSNPYGAIANYSSADNFDRANDKINIQYRCFGAQYNDPILAWEFNRTTAMFNDDLEIVEDSEGLRALLDGKMKLKRGERYTQIPNSYLDYFNYECYPMIHPVTWELMWFIENDRYAEIMAKIQTQSSPISPEILNNPSDSSPLANPQYGFKSGALDDEVKIDG